MSTDSILTHDTSTAAPASESRAPHKVLHISLWVAQVLLAAMFGMAGTMKTSAPMAELVQKMVWPGALPEALVRFIGLSELAAAIGLILPAATRIKPSLTPLAATGLVAVMALASVFHATRGEFFAFPINFGLAALAAFVAWGRYRKAPNRPALTRQGAARGEGVALN